MRWKAPNRSQDKVKWRSGQGGMGFIVEKILFLIRMVIKCVTAFFRFGIIFGTFC